MGTLPEVPKCMHSGSPLSSMAEKTGSQWSVWNDGWSSVTTLGCVGAGLALISVFAVIESRVHNPLLPLHIIWDRTRGGSFLTVAAALAVARVRT